MNTNRKLAKIALCLREDSYYVREILEGIRAFAVGDKGWTFRFFALDKKNIPIIESWRPDGMIVNVGNDLWCHHLLKYKVPTVNVNTIMPHPLIPWIGGDDLQIGIVGAEHLISRGLHHLAFVGYNEWAFSEKRKQSFQNTVISHGFTFDALENLGPAEIAGENQWSIDIEKMLADWIADLPKPVGIMACNDRLAFHVASICREAGLSVPDDVAILGVDDDPLLCDLSYPPLSSVALPLRRIGYEAANLLSQGMDGNVIKLEGILLPPKTVSVRQSTQFTNVNDDVLSNILTILSERHTEPINIEIILDELAISRRKVERRFKDILGVSPHSVLRRLRIETAEKMLCNTDLPINEVAERSGFGKAKNLSKIFRQVKNMTPSDFRQQFKLSKITQRTQ